MAPLEYFKFMDTVMTLSVQYDDSHCLLLRMRMCRAFYMIIIKNTEIRFSRD